MGNDNGNINTNYRYIQILRLNLNVKNNTFHIWLLSITNII